MVRGIRGATVAEANTKEAIRAATTELLLRLQEENGFQPEELASILFTMTPDLNAEHPAVAARRLGWVDVPLLCSVEIDVPGQLERVIRVLLLWNTDRSARAVRHVYLGAAQSLRPDLVGIAP